MTEIRVLSEPTTYSRENPDASFFADLYRYQNDGDLEARDRLEQGSKETLIDAEARGIQFRDVEGRAMSSNSGAGGDFLPPLYFGDLYAEFKRARRVTASLVDQLPLPAKGNTITVPLVTGGDTTAAQTADNQNLSNTDATTNIVTIPVCSVAGYVTMSRQILERALPGLDRIIAQDLLADYGKQVNNYVLNGSGSAGQPKGVLKTAYNAITFGGTSTVPLLYPKLLDANRQVTEAVFEPATAWIMTARRWAWILGATDSNGRPLVVPEANPPYVWDATKMIPAGYAGALGTDAHDIWPAGTLIGIPVYVDETVSKVLGTGTNQDEILTAVWKRHILWEDAAGPRTFEFADFSGAQTAQVRIEVYGSMAFTAERFPTATSVITGTGLQAPTF